MAKVPSLSLAKRTPQEGTPEWLRHTVKKHGSTEPLQLEHRRAKLSGLIISLEESLQQIQAMVKNPALAPEHKAGLQITVATLIAQLAQVEALSLIVDCVTLRWVVKKKNGEKGYTRHSVSSYLYDIMLNSYETQDMVKTLLGQPVSSDDEDEEEVDEAEVVTEAEEKEIKKGAKR